MEKDRTLTIPVDWISVFLVKKRLDTKTNSTSMYNRLGIQFIV